MAKAFSIEDGNLSNKTIITSRTKLYKDIDLSFAKKLSGDIFKKTDAAAVKQSIKNILMTNKTEKPFDPLFGGGLNSHLFDLSTEVDEDDIRDTIYTAVYNSEKRALIKNVDVNVSPDSHELKISVVFQVMSTEEVDTLNISLTRLR